MAKKAGAVKEIGACAYRATSVDMKDKKRIISPKVFRNPEGFTYRQEGHSTSLDLPQRTMEYYQPKGSRKHQPNT